MWQKIKAGLANFMTGRHGSDQLGLALLIAGIVLSLISSLTGIGIISYLGLAVYFWAIFRMFSRNVAKRRAENEKYMAFQRNFKTNISQFFARLKNSKDYKYFKCPQCKARLRLPRKIGEKTVKCPRCQHEFKKKA